MSGGRKGERKLEKIDKRWFSKFNPDVAKNLAKLYEYIDNTELSGMKLAKMLGTSGETVSNVVERDRGKGYLANRLRLIRERKRMERPLDAGIKTLPAGYLPFIRECQKRAINVQPCFSRLINGSKIDFSRLLVSGHLVHLRLSTSTQTKSVGQGRSAYRSFSFKGVGKREAVVAIVINGGIRIWVIPWTAVLGHREINIPIHRKVGLPGGAPGTMPSPSKWWGYYGKKGWCRFRRWAKLRARQSLRSQTRM